MLTSDVCGFLERDPEGRMQSKVESRAAPTGAMVTPLTTQRVAASRVDAAVRMNGDSTICRGALVGEHRVPADIAGGHAIGNRQLFL